MLSGNLMPESNVIIYNTTMPLHFDCNLLHKARFGISHQPHVTSTEVQIWGTELQIWDFRLSTFILY